LAVGGGAVVVSGGAVVVVDVVVVDVVVVEVVVVGAVVVVDEAVVDVVVVDRGVLLEAEYAVAAPELVVATVLMKAVTTTASAIVRGSLLDMGPRSLVPCL
jgi:hypothetical protein